MKALGLVVSEKKIFLCFSHCKPMGANDTRGGAIFDPSGMIFYVLPHHVPGRGLYGPQGHGWQDMKRTTIHCYTQTMKDFGEEDCFMFFPL